MKISGEWFRKEGATQEDISEVIKCLDFSPPVEYLELLEYSNGGEGPLSVQPYNFVLYSTEEVVEYENDQEIEISGYFVFGGDGGGEYIAINKNSMCVVAIDACNSDFDESVVEIAKYFNEFISYVGKEGEMA